MEAHPPSYGDAISRNPWLLVAPYIERKDLLSAALVCRDWHAVFARELWGSPASQFDAPGGIRSPADVQRTKPAELNSSAHYFQLASFRRSCKIARPRVCAFTHTLRIPTQYIDPLQDLYSTTSTGLPASWFRDLLARLPSLRSLVVQGVGQVDHEALMAFAREEDGLAERVRRQNLVPDLSGRLKLLDASFCPHVTAKGLVVLLGKALGLVYLDLSGTVAAKEASVLDSLDRMRHLKLLMLRRLQPFSYERMERLCRAIGRRLTWLDLEGNNLDDRSAKALLDHCIGDGLPDEDRPPMYHETPPKASKKKFDPAQLATDSYHHLTSSSGSRLTVEENADAGITHLKLGHNSFESFSAIDLISSGKLTFLDLGSSPIRTSNASRPRPASRYPALSHLRVPYAFFFSRVLDLSKTAHTDQEMLLCNTDSMIPRSLACLQTLELTGIPPSSPTSSVANDIIRLIRVCARCQRGGRPFDKSFNLQTITLEISSIHNSNDYRSRSMAGDARGNRAQPQRTRSSKGWNYAPTTKAVTGDTDSEALWQFAENQDFSFFDEPELDDGGDSPVDGIGEESPSPSVDVIAEIVRFRNQARRRWDERGTANGRLQSADLSAEDYWPGSIKVMRV